MRSTAGRFASTRSSVPGSLHHLRGQLAHELVRRRPLAGRSHLPTFVRPVRGRSPVTANPSTAETPATRGAKADVVLENRNQKHSDKGSQFSDSRGHTMPGGTHAHGENLEGKTNVVIFGPNWMKK